MDQMIIESDGIQDMYFFSNVAAFHQEQDLGFWDFPLVDMDVSFTTAFPQSTTAIPRPSTQTIPPGLC